jgi:hypothetical protein
MNHPSDTSIWALLTLAVLAVGLIWLVETAAKLLR